MTDHFSRFLSASPSRNMERVAIRRRDPFGLYSVEDANAWARKQPWHDGKEHLVVTNRYFAWFRPSRER